MPLIDFEWEDAPEEIEGVGPCFVAYATDSDSGQCVRVAVALAELEDVARRKALHYEQSRKH